MGKDDTAKFGIELETKGADGARDQSSALEELRNKVLSGQQALRGMQQALRNLNGGSVVNIASARQLMSSIARQKDTLARAQEGYIKLGGSMGQLAKRRDTGKDSAEAIKSLADNLRAASGPAGSMIGRARELATTLGKAGVAGAAIAAAAAAAILVGAIAAITIALGKFGLEAANARRGELLMLEGMTKIPNWFGIAAGKATELQDSIDRVSDSSALGRDKITGFVQELYKAGLRGKNLEAALDATSTAASGANEAYGNIVKGWAIGTAYAGGSVQKLADRIKGQLGGVARAKMLDLNVQMSKFKEGVSRLFSGLKIEGFLSALHEVLSLFTEQTAVGRAFKALLETIFNPLFEAVGKAQPMVKRFFQGMTIAGLMFAIEVLKIRNAIRDAFGLKDKFKGLDWMQVGLYAGYVAGGLLIATLTTLAAVLAICAVASVLAFAPLILATVLVGAAIIGLIYVFTKAAAGIYWLWEKAKEAYAFLASLDWSALGQSLIDGLVNGITSGADAVVAAVKDMAKSAWKGFQDALGMHSPSKLFLSAGLNIDRSVVGGLEAGKPAVVRSVRHLVPNFAAPPMPSMASPEAPNAPPGAPSQDSGPGSAPPAAAAAPSAPAAPQRAGNTYYVTIHVSGGESAKTTAEDIWQELLRRFEAAAASMGTAA